MNLPPDKQTRRAAGRLSRTDATDPQKLGAPKRGPIFVLVEPQMGENIGAAARAMLNFGASALRIVNPRDGWPNEKAGAMAAGAAAVLDNAQVFDTLDAALGDCHYMLATTARQRDLATAVLGPREAAGELSARIDAGQICAVVFGSERNGLASEDVARADAILSFPVNPAFASLNLAQAACLVAYEWSQTPSAANVSLGAERAPAERDNVAGLVDHFLQELDAVDYFRPPEKKPLMVRNLRVALTQAGFTNAEVRSLRGALKALAEKRNKS